MEQTKIRIGKIINCHGIKGEIILLPLTSDMRRFKKLKKAYIEQPKGRYEEVSVLSAREHKGNVLLELEGISDRNQAELLKNRYMCVNEEDAVKPKGSYFIYEIVGLEVYEGETCLGKISDVLQNSSTDLYEVTGEDRTFYLPALKTVVKNIDLEQGRMEVEVPAGLLD